MEENNSVESPELKISKIILKQNELEESIRKGKDSLNKGFINLESQINSLKSLQRELKDVVDQTKANKEAYSKNLKDLTTSIKKYEQEFTPTHGM